MTTIVKIKLHPGNPDLEIAKLANGYNVIVPKGEFAEDDEVKFTHVTSEVDGVVCEGLISLPEFYLEDEEPEEEDDEETDEEE